MMEFLVPGLSGLVSAVAGFGVARYQEESKRRSNRSSAAIQQPAADARVAIEGFTALVEQLQEEVRDCKRQHEQAAVREVKLHQQVFELRLEVTQLRHKLEERSEEGYTQETQEDDPQTEVVHSDKA